MTQDEIWGDRAEQLVLEGADITLLRGEVEVDRRRGLFHALRTQVQWRQDHIVMYGRSLPLPRLTAWFGDEGRSYSYSGITMSPDPWRSPLVFLRRVAERAAAESFNSVLCNLYRAGTDGLNWHSDDEQELGNSPTIASVNLGATRRFIIRRKDDHSKKIDISLSDGDVLVMRGATQQFCEHSVPKTKRVVGERINLTFRRILG
jgi:alkylated DNA repair dioxygenase AlkB